ncbi:hypothetical protein V1J52_07585 [Streptomyces sp. TRM 70351]|uniref:DUF7544 domain-containing protein n=1 Tax=Streptomyces sp. TRM 70351 TaxID=3116552 RepID=UPI002E7C0EAE|nr:hypothetical protein [Streptomyces sp. TRM 70351]MEE1928058.1 hypothetical protein [Streptomyces sp. TRM 70351]
MNDSPGWASPGASGSGSSEDRGRDPSDSAAQGPAGPPQPTGWSTEQPPPAAPGGWGPAPPPPPGTPPSGGPGQPHGWGGGRPDWRFAPAAKPGVIPLRPLGVSDILDGAVSTMRAHWRPVLGIALGVAVCVELIATLVTGLWFSDNRAMAALQNDPTPTTDELTDAMSTTFSNEGVGMLAAMIGTVIATAMLTMVVSRAVLGRSVTVAEAWQDARPLLLRLLGLLLLITLIIVGVLLLCLLPGLLLIAAGASAAGAALVLLGALAGIAAMMWLWIRYCLAAPALMLERGGVLGSLRRSAKLVRGSWWRLFGIQLLAVLLVMVLGFVISLPAQLLAAAVSGEPGGLLGVPATFSWPYLIVLGIGAVITSTITLPFSAGVTALLYIDARIRREALDLELARAAGVSGASPQHPRPGPPGS